MTRRERQRIDGAVKGIAVGQSVTSTGFLHVNEKVGEGRSRRVRGRLIGGAGSATKTFRRSSHAVAMWLRGKMKPIDVSPAEVRDGQGNLIALIKVDPVTGKRTREAVS